MNTPREFVQGFTIDNSTPLSNMLGSTYGLQDLQDYFGQIPPNECAIYGSGSNAERFSISNINKAFPVECIRQNGVLCYYSVYKVREGGYFYVFWTKSNGMLDLSGETQANDNATAYSAVYIPSLKKASDFNAINPGISTAEDVAQIDPAIELTFLMSSGVRSFSLLEDGTVLEFQYEYDGDITSRRDLIVKSSTVHSKEVASSVSYLASIFLTDLP